VESTAEDVLAFEQFNSICRKAEILRENLSVMLSKNGASKSSDSGYAEKRNGNHGT